MSYPLWLIEACQHRWLAIATNRRRCLGLCGVVPAGSPAAEPPLTGMDWNRASLVQADRLGRDLDRKGPAASCSVNDDRYPYVWRWRVRLPERRGQRCRIVARGALNSAAVEFPDGVRVITSGWAVRRASA
jgi:hypothetical protein